MTLASPSPAPILQSNHSHLASPASVSGRLELQMCATACSFLILGFHGIIYKHCLHYPMKATSKELCLFHYPDLTHKGYWKVFLQWRVFTNLQKSKYVPPVVLSAWQMFSGSRIQCSLLWPIIFSTSNLSSSFIWCKVSHWFLVHLVSAFLNSALIFHTYTTTRFVPRWNSFFFFLI